MSQSKMSLRISFVSFFFLLALFLEGGNIRAYEFKLFSPFSLKRPIFLVDTGESMIGFLIAEQRGLLYSWQPREKTTRVVLDLRSQVRRINNEEGLLGLALDPLFSRNRFLYLCYSASDPRRNVYARYTWNLETKSIDPGSRRIFLTVPQPYGNHNGGMIAFGPDGFFYISLGDGGSAGDPGRRAQNRRVLLGKILRIDLATLKEGKRYRIPRDNPFAGHGEYRGEIWAYGLRNVWRFSFDRKTGDLWAGDVGQNKWEEIDLIVKGGNYGWDIREGRHPFRGRTDGKTFIDPVVEHGRREAMSITGGYVYRGKEVPLAFGHYIYGDYVTGKLWSLQWKKGKIHSHVAFQTLPQIVSFAEDTRGELYLLSFDGRIYKLRTLSAHR